MLAAAVDQNTEFSVPAIAAATGLTRDAVEHVLNSPTYHELMHREAKHLFVHALTRATHAMDRIVNSRDPKTSNNARIAAAGAIGRLYEVATKRSNQPPAEPPEGGIEAWAAEFKLKATT